MTIFFQNILFTKIKKGSGTSFWFTFFAWFLHTNAPYQVLYQLTKFQCSIDKVPSQDIKQNLLLSSYLDNRNINAKNTSPWWMIKFEDSTRKKIGQIDTLINCKKSNTFTAHQLSLKHKFQKKHGNTNTSTPEYKIALLKHDLKLPAQNSNAVNENTNAKLLTDLFQKILKEYIEILREQKSILRTHRARMKLNRSGKVFGVKMLHLIRMLHG